MPVLQDTVLENVLSYIQSEKCVITRDQILVNALAYYQPELILKAKDVLFKIVGEQAPKRKKCQAHPNPCSADLEDILNVFEKHDDGEIKLPSFVAFGYGSMPPSAGFESFASVMCSLRDEVTALRVQVDEVKNSNEKDQKALENVGSIIQDVSELKLLLLDLPSKVGELNKTSSKAEQVLSSSSPSNSASSDCNQNDLPSGSSSMDGQEANTPEMPLYTSVLGRNEPAKASNANKTNVSSKPSQEWQTVQRNNRRSKISNSNSNGQQRRGDAANANQNRQYTSRRNISGKRTSDVRLRAAPRILDVFLGGCGLDTTPEIIMDYCKKYDIELTKCESVASKSEHHKCFKVSVSAENRDALLDGEFWPVGTFVGKFYKRKALHTGSQ